MYGEQLQSIYASLRGFDALSAPCFPQTLGVSTRAPGHPLWPSSPSTGCPPVSTPPSTLKVGYLIITAKIHPQSYSVSYPNARRKTSTVHIQVQSRHPPCKRSYHCYCTVEVRHLKLEMAVVSNTCDLGQKSALQYLYIYIKLNGRYSSTRETIEEERRRQREIASEMGLLKQLL